MNDEPMNYDIAQRGRALIDFEVGVRQEANRLLGRAEARLAERGVTAQSLPDDMGERHAVIDGALADFAPFKTQALLGDWNSRQHGLVCEAAFDEIRDDLVPQLDALAHGPTTLTEIPGFVPPRYWSEVWFHRTHGGWDASDYNGFIHGELVHKRFVAKVFPGDIYGFRRSILDQLSRFDHKRILEFGTSSGHYTLALAERFPDAEITGVDPSRRMLEQARRVANQHGYAWKLHVGVGEDTGFADESFDLVTSYAIHHELPPRIIERWFDEARRLLKPGGELLMIDVPRYADLDKLGAWRFDRQAKWAGEPYWRASASLDFGEGAEKAGFEDVRAEGLGPTHNPYYVYGRKTRG